eukprot:2932213-Pyramimonas_sp.AAC.1
MQATNADRERAQVAPYQRVLVAQGEFQISSTPPVLATSRGASGEDPRADTLGPNSRAHERRGFLRAERG